MSFDAIITEGIEIGGTTVIKSNTYTGTAELKVSEPVADSETDKEIQCAIDVSAIQALLIVSTQTVTLEINDGAGGGGTLALVADEPVVWHVGSVYTNLLAVDVTSIFITNSSGSTAQVSVYTVTDATP